MGDCVYDANAPNGTCIYGDDVVVNNDVNGLMTFQAATCRTAISLLIRNGLDPVYWCNSNLFSFKKKCCKSCSSKHFK
jgi:hypothetical protein